jgi:transposase
MAYKRSLFSSHPQLLLMATDTSIESNIIALHLTQVSYTEIEGRIHVGQMRISRTSRQFYQFGIVPDALRIGRPRKIQSDLIAFIEARTLRKPSVSGVELSREIEEQFGVPVSRTTITVLRRSLRFKYQPR